MMSDTDGGVDGGTTVVDMTTPVPDAASGCTTDEMCGPGGRCEGGACVDPECRSNDECGNLQLCRDYACLNRCLGDRTCFGGGICVDGACEDPECADDPDCGEGRICRNQRCQDASPCETAADCGDDERCTDGNCEPHPSCGGDQQCAMNEICDDGLCRPRTGCEDDAMCAEGEDCVGGRCVPFVCRGDADCAEAERCLAGVCAVPASAAVESVIIITRPQPLVGPIRLRAVGLDVFGDIVASSGFAWESSDPAVLAVDADSGAATPQEDASGRVEVAAAYTNEDGGVVTSAPVAFEVGALEVPEGFSVMAYQLATGAPLVGATIQMGAQEQVTDDNGAVRFEPDEEAQAITVFAEGHDYVTIMGNVGESVVIPVPPRSADALVAGIKGTVDFRNVEGGGAISLGLSGASFSRGLLDLGLAELLGEIFNVDVNLGPLGSVDLPIPAGITINAEFPGVPELKSTYYATAAPGLQLAWSFAGRLDFGEIGGLIMGGGGVSVGRVLGTILPFFERFPHGVRVAPDLRALPRLPDEGDIDGDGDVEELLPAYSRFESLDTVPDHSQDLRLAITLQREDDETPILLFSGVDVEGTGFVPLGVSVSTSPQPVATRMAAPHSGLEVGGPVVVALRGEFGGGNVLPQNVSVQMRRFADRMPEQIDFDAPFLALPGGIDWNAALRTFGADSVDGAGLNRVVFVNGEGRWTVYTNGGGALEFTLPFPPAGYPDLSGGALIRLEAITVSGGADLDALLVPAGGVHLGNLDGLATGFSRRVSGD